MPVIAVTGELCSGKSAVLKFLQKKGAKTFSSDRLVHTYYKDKNSLIYRRIKQCFPNVFNCKGVLLRSKLAEVVFSDIRYLRKLEEIVHPLIIRDLRKWVFSNKAHKGIYVAEVPLLFERQLEKIFDIIILVYASKSTLIKRIKKKFKISYREAEQRLGHFIPVDKKRKNVDFVINNNSNLKKLERKVELIWGRLRRG
mgnify:CR=1 FL=1